MKALFSPENTRIFLQCTRKTGNSEQWYLYRGTIIVI